jgi:hypothetical protein
MSITQSQLEGLTKQVFMLEYIINGLFPCQSDVVRLIRSKKKEWKFNDKFEYRMLLATTNSGGSLNTQVFKENTSMVRPGNLEYGVYRASYGSVMDGFNVDMMVNLETKEKYGAFKNDYAMRLGSLRQNVAGLFKNFAIHGQWGVVHQLRASITAPLLDPAYTPRANVGFTPVPGVPFTIKTPINVFASNFKTGKLLIKTTENAPWGAADGSEMYYVLDNQPNYLSLLPCGNSCSPWVDGNFLEVASNREINGGDPNFFNSWTYQTFDVASGPYTGKYDKFTGTGVYTSGGNDGVIGAMEGLADLFPWYTDPAQPGKRLGMDLPFRDQRDRLLHSTEQAGGWVYQQDGEHIIDCIMRGSFLTKATVPYAEVGVWINPVTRTRMGYEEGDNVKVLRDNFVAGPIVYQRGVKTTDYQIGNQVVKEIVEDMNMPTDVIIIGPKDDISYNCWDNSLMQIDNYIQETWGKAPPPRPEDISIPNDFLAKLDISNRIIFGSPTMSDGGMAHGIDFGNRIRHPKNMMPIALQEMGALFTEYPYTYTVIKLQEPICDVTTG